MSNLVVTPEKVEFGKRVKEKRLAKGLTQAQLTKRIGTKSPCNLQNWEAGRAIPKKEMMKILAKELGVTTDYLLKGDPEEEKPVITITKDETKNPEGYNDMTAAKAIAKVDHEKRLRGIDISSGDVCSIGTIKYVIISIVGPNAIVLPLSRHKSMEESDYIASFMQGEDTYYCYFSQTEHKRLNQFDKKCFEMSDVSYKVIYNRLLKALGFVHEANVRPLEPDDMSVIFANSIEYFNAKNGSNIEPPKGIVTLKQAVDISTLMDISLSELTRDHEQDKILDEICKLDEEKKALEERIAALNAKIGLS